MKKLLLLSGALLMAIAVFAQQDVINKKVTPIFEKKFEQPAQAKDFIFDGRKYVNKYGLKIPTDTTYHWINDMAAEASATIGTTSYDLQTNSSTRSAIIEHSPNNVSIVFTQYHGTSTTYPERGTGYARFDGTDWFDNGMSGNPRVEGNNRSGWGNLLSNGTQEFVISHGQSQGAYGRYQNIGAAMANWAGIADISFSPYLLWPRTASAGNYYYVIACAADEFGTNKHGFRFGRSTNAGQTWDFVVPQGWGDIFWIAGGDGYSIDARDSIVAFVIFDGWAGVHLWKSTDYGQTFTYRTIVDFPVKKYNPTAGPLIDMDNNNIADTLITTDECGDLVIDNNGKCHVVFGRMRLLDEEIDAQGGTSYFPYTDYILYWNEDMPDGHYPGGVTSPSFHDTYCAEEVDTVAWFFDLNNDGDFSFPVTSDLPFGKYYTALTSMPTLAVDEYNNIIMAYTMVMDGEDYTKNNATPNAQNYRYVWLRIRYPWGEWGPFLNVSEGDGYAENVFPDLAPHIKGEEAFYLWYQFDGEPGLHVRGDSDPIAENNIIGKQILIAYGDSTFVGKNEISKIKATVSPNPVRDILTVETNDNSKISIIDINGRQVMSINAASRRTNINVSNLQNGVYIVRITTNNGTTERKIIKH